MYGVRVELLSAYVINFTSNALIRLRFLNHLLRGSIGSLPTFRFVRGSHV